MRRAAQSKHRSKSAWVLVLGALLVWLGSTRRVVEGAAEIEKKAAPEIEKKAAPKKRAPKKKPSLAKRAGKKDLVWLDLDKGLGIVRTKYLPILIWYDGEDARQDGGDGKGVAPAQRPPVENNIAEVLGHSALATTLRKYTLIRVSSADLTRTYKNPPGQPRDLSRKALAKAKAKARADAKRGNKARPKPKPKPKPKPNLDLLAAKKEKVVEVGEKLRLPAGQPALLLLDYRERIVERYDLEIPTRSRLTSRLKHVAKANAFYAKKAFGIEKVLVEAQKAYLVGNSRAAVLKVRGLESEKLRKAMDPVLQGWSAKTIETYRTKANRLLGEAGELEREGDKLKVDSSLKYNKALRAFAKVAKDFPFLDVTQKANRRRADILRKMTVTGENPFGK